jgi:hypothetical protein
MQAQREYSHYSFLTSALDGMRGQYHAPVMLYPQERTPSTHGIGGWVGLRAGLDSEATGKILCLCQELNPGHSKHISQLAKPYNNFPNWDTMDWTDGVQFLAIISTAPYPESHWASPIFWSNGYQGPFHDRWSRFWMWSYHLSPCNAKLVTHVVLILHAFMEWCLHNMASHNYSF